LAIVRLFALTDLNAGEIVGRIHVLLRMPQSATDPRFYIHSLNRTDIDTPQETHETIVATSRGG
jgi:hypothetical protein